MLRRTFFILTALTFLLPAISSAEGMVTSVKGTALMKDEGQGWHILKDGEGVKEGATIWISASSSILLRAGNDLIEIAAGADGQEIVILKLAPLDISGKGVNIRQVGPPAPPSLIAPPNGYRSTVGNIEFAWSSPQKEALYHIQISAGPEFDKILLDEKSYNRDRKIEGLGTGRFYWRVSVINRDGLESGFSETRSFYVRPLPEPPSINPPASTKTSTTFRWKRGSEEERYHLQISKDKEFSDPTVDLRYIEGPRVTVGMMEEGDYFVRVSAIDEDGLEGRFSEPIPFYVGPKVPSTNIGPLMIMLGVAFMLLGL